MEFPMRLATSLSAATALSVLLSGCAVVRQDQVGLRTTLGRVDPKPAPPGAHFVFPFTQGMIRIPSRTVNREVRLELPSREGLNVAAEVSILYRVRPEMAAKIFETAGARYEEDIVIPVFRSAAADVAARFMAKDMHSGERTAIEKGVRDHMMQVLDGRGFVIESVLLKSIQLPRDLAQAVEDKLTAEQRSEQMRFVLDRERQEAERRAIEAQGIRDAQQIIGQGLTPLLISFQSIEAFRELARSPNTKVVVTDGRSPFLISSDLGGTMEPFAAPANDRTPVTGGSVAPASRSGAAAAAATRERPR
jgi:regulator of protease activity HflC (stomatin/prohibitin superfamily)